MKKYFKALSEISTLPLLSYERFCKSFQIVRACRSRNIRANRVNSRGSKTKGPVNVLMANDMYLT